MDSELKHVVIKYGVICFGLLLLIIFITYFEIRLPLFFPFYLLVLFVLICGLFLIIALANNEYSLKKMNRERMKRLGLVEYKGRWGTPEQVFEWEQLDKGLVKYQNKWVAREEKIKLEEEERKLKELFEAEQKQKGLVKYIDSEGREHWGSSEEIQKLRQKDFDEEQKAKGLVKYRGEWVSAEEAFLKRINAKKSEKIATEIAIYIKEKSKGTLLDKRTFDYFVSHFWYEKYHCPFTFWVGSNPKVREVESMVPGRFIDVIVKDLTEWALNRNLARLTKADVKLFLANRNMKLSTSFEQMVHREAKLKYRYLPPWMRK